MALPKGARILPNGDIFFPKKGRPPEAVQGFKRDKNDPWLFHSLYGKCKHRTVDRVEYPCASCGRGVKYYRCTLKKKEVSFLDCTPCEEREEV